VQTAATAVLIIGIGGVDHRQPLVRVDLLLIDGVLSVRAERRA
jgi:hypothetical protein